MREIVEFLDGADGVLIKRRVWEKTLAMLTPEQQCLLAEELGSDQIERLDVFGVVEQ